MHPILFLKYGCDKLELVGAHKGGRLNLGEIQSSFYVPMIQKDITVSVCAISY